MSLTVLYSAVRPEPFDAVRPELIEGTNGGHRRAEQIEALSDDPDEMQRQLQDMAGPGAVIRVDSFEGERLPPKAQIKAIHITRDAFAAENHSAGSIFIDIITQPGGHERPDDPIQLLARSASRKPGRSAADSSPTRGCRSRKLRHHTGYSGTMTSPFFRLPTNVQGTPKVDIGLNFSF